MNEMVKTIKEIHSNDVCLFKIGSFYHAYGRDAYILSYLFDYKLKDETNNIKACGFPVTNVAKIMAKLENKKINYLIIDKRNSYDVDEKSDNGNLNCYDEIYEKARKQINIKRRIDEINDFFISNLDKKNIKQIIEKVEEVIYETGKI